MTSTLITAYLGQGLLAARPAAPALATGAIGFYWATDTQVMYAYTNGAWRVASAGVDLYSPPLAASFPTIINGGAAAPPPSVTDTSYGMLFDSGATAAGADNIRGAFQAIPHATTFTVTMGVRITMAPQNFRFLGLGVSDSTKYEVIALVGGGAVNTGTGLSGGGLQSARFSNSTTFSASNAIVPNEKGDQYYFRIVGDGVNLKFSWSKDGRNFIQLYSEAIGAFLGAITRCGVIANANANVTPPAAGDHIFGDVFYWSATTP
jgi:hypothetical protein